MKIIINKCNNYCLDIASFQQSLKKRENNFFIKGSFPSSQSSARNKEKFYINKVGKAYDKRRENEK